MGDIGPLVVNITANASGMIQTFSDLTGSARQFQRGLENISKTMTAAFFAATSAAVAMTIQAGKTAEETEQLAQKTGIAAASIEGMSVAMARHGLNSQSIATAMRGLSKEMIGVQQRTSSSIKTFQDLGLSLSAVEKGTGAMLRAIADRFKELPDGAMKAKLAVDLFGRSGLDLIPMLNKGGAAFEESMKKAAEFGVILTDVQRSSLTVFDDAMDDLMVAIKGVGMQVGIAFAPSLTILVNAFTDAIVFLKHSFNQLSDAGSVLAIRFAAIVASAQLLSANLFSLKAFSKEAWQEALNHVKAIDAWAASEIHGVAAAREATKGLDALASKQLDAALAVQKHAHNQKTLGEQIVATTKIQLQQAAELNNKIFTDIFNAQEQADQANYLQGPDPNAETGMQRILRENLMLAEADFALQRAFYAQAPGLIGAATAARAKGIEAIEAEAEMQAHAINQLIESEESKNSRLIALDAETQAKRMALARQFPTFWEQQLNALVASNTFSIGQIVSTWTSGLANAIVNGTDFIKAAWQSTQLAIVQGALNTGVQLAAQWAQQALIQAGILTKSVAERLVTHTATEHAMTAVTAAQEAVRVSIAVASAKAMGAANAVAIASLTSVGLAAVGVLEAALIGITGFLSAVAAAVSPIPIVGQVLAGSIIVGLTLAQIAGQAAIAAATAGIAAAGSAAAAGLSFQEGGVGHFGSGTPAILHGTEAIIPLNQRGADFMNQALWTGARNDKFEQTIILDGRVLAHSVHDHLPSMWRANGLPG